MGHDDAIPAVTQGPAVRTHTRIEALTHTHTHIHTYTHTHIHTYTHTQNTQNKQKQSNKQTKHTHTHSHNHTHTRSQTLQCFLQLENRRSNESVGCARPTGCSALRWRKGNNLRPGCNALRWRKGSNLRPHCISSSTSLSSPSGAVSSAPCMCSRCDNIVAKWSEMHSAMSWWYNGEPCVLIICNA